MMQTMYATMTVDDTESLAPVCNCSCPAPQVQVQHESNPLNGVLLVVVVILAVRLLRGK